MAKPIISIKITELGGKFGKKLENVIRSRLESAAVILQRKMRKKFSKEPFAKFRKRPGGTYPRKLNGHAMNSVFATKLSGRNVIRIGSVSHHPQYAMRLSWLETETRISPKGSGALAIPLSMAAKRHASNARTRGAGGPKTFGVALTMVVIKAKRGKRKGMKQLFLVEKRDGASKKMGMRRFVLHYLITRKTIIRPAYLGVSDAFMDESKWFINKITGSMQNELENL